MYRNLQLLAVLADPDLAGRIHLGKLDLIQVDPGIAVRLRVHLVSVVQAQLLDQLHRFAFAVGDRHLPLALYQMHARRARLPAAGRA